MTRDPTQVREFLELAIVELEAGRVQVTDKTSSQKVGYSFTAKEVPVEVLSLWEGEGGLFLHTLHIDGVHLYDLDLYNRRQVVKLFEAARVALGTQEKCTHEQERTALEQRLGTILAR